MKLKLVREIFTDKSTIGKLFINEEFECYTLEDVVREEKIFGETAIPEGLYKVVTVFSNHFKRRVPLLVNVPNFQGIEIHVGNTPKDTNGCVLVGRKDGVNRIFESVLAFESLYKKIEKAEKSGDEITIDVTHIIKKDT